ncbi:MAG: YgiQ family radical SAM protein [Candidatus Thermoplasmatota archaeon]|nr:YgiQ family radical SAM protein [Candidatus Thermoplasmatota archaeon]
MISDRPSKNGFDVILVTGDGFVDHPSFGAAVIARVIESAGHSVGIISQPSWKDTEDFRILGRPRLFFGVTAGNLDSMVSNYTPLKREREYDSFSPNGRPGQRPDRATIVYSMRIHEAFKDVPIVIGGIEASLRRLAHYDYWDNKLRRSILFDSRADVLVYGMGEEAVLALLEHYSKHAGVPLGIENTCVNLKENPDGHLEIPSFEEISESKEKFCEAYRLYSRNDMIAQAHGNRYLVQYPMGSISTEEVDRIYSLPFSRKAWGDVPALRTVRFSVVTHRGCFGNCSFCSLSMHQGRLIRSRSERSILNEIKIITRMKGFNGTIDDLGGPTANMYGMECSSPCPGKDNCMICSRMDRSHDRLVELMKSVRGVKGVKNLFISSGIRYDLAMNSLEYVNELVKHHVPGRIKLAPEHVDKEVLRLMGKPEIEVFHRFKYLLQKIDPNVRVLPYFMAAHPGCGIPEMKELMEFVKKHGEFEQCQIFTPTPMTLSTCMYWTGLDPNTMEEVYVPYTYKEKKVQKAMMLPRQMDGERRMREFEKDRSDAF